MWRLCCVCGALISNVWQDSKEAGKKVMINDWGRNLIEKYNNDNGKKNNGDKEDWLGLLGFMAYQPL